MTDDELTAMRAAFDEINEKFPNPSANVHVVDHIDHIVVQASAMSASVVTPTAAASTASSTSTSGQHPIELVRRGYAGQIEKIWGGNLMRVFRDVRRRKEIQARVRPDPCTRGLLHAATARRVLAAPPASASAAPLCEIEHASATGIDDQPATVRDGRKRSDCLRSGQYGPVLGLPEEAPNAEALLMNYLNRFFEVRANGEKIDLRIQSKRLKGEGDNTALAVEFEHTLDAPLATLAVRNAVFTDLFDQNNIVYVHVDDDSRSLMLSKNTPETELAY